MPAVENNLHFKSFEIKKHRLNNCLKKLALNQIKKNSVK